MKRIHNALIWLLLLVTLFFVTGCTPENNDNDVRVTTYTPQDITSTSAVCGGDVIVTQGLSLTSLGVCWSTSRNPTVEDDYLSTSNWSEPYVCTLIGLEPDTRYHVRAFALRGLEYYYGDDKSFVTEKESAGGGGGGHPTSGVLNGVFSVGDNSTVRFSQGNLQYIGSAGNGDENNTGAYWKFAEHQWDCLFTTTGQNSGLTNVDRDLFCWGTSGYNHGANCYQPWSTSTFDNSYYAYGNSYYDLYDQTGQADWGYNAIINGGNQENSGWRTLTRDEWYYLFHNRNTPSGIRYAKAEVNEVSGMILLPDDWNNSYYALNNTNISDASFNSNTITASQWEILEQHGAVFLPAAGFRGGTSVLSVGSRGYYWSASCYDTYGAWYVHFFVSSLDTDGRYGRDFGRSVRLVRSAQ